jgi:hypothetical protein
MQHFNSPQTHTAAFNCFKGNTRAFALLVILVLMAFLSGCARQAAKTSDIKEVTGRTCQEPEDLLDMLAKFSTAIQGHQYHQGIAMLVPEDQARMLGPDGKVPEDIKNKLDALNFKSLPTDRRIDLVNQKLKGVFDCLPCLDQGEATVLPKEEKAKTPTKEEGEAILEKARVTMAKDFIRKVRSGRFQAASDLVHPDEWKVFLDDKGKLTDLSERRLQAIEECDIDALTVKDGRLTGVVLLLDPPVSDLYLRSGVFFDFIEANRIPEALGMILETEKKFFVDDKGKLRPDRIEKLKALNRSDWRKLYLYHNVLIGVAEAAVGYQNL